MPFWQTDDDTLFNQRLHFGSTSSLSQIRQCRLPDRHCLGQVLLMFIGGIFSLVPGGWKRSAELDISEFVPCLFSIQRIQCRLPVSMGPIIEPTIVVKHLFSVRRYQ